MVQNPDRVELDAAQFSVIATPDSDAPSAAWTLVVRHLGPDANEPRVVRDASCQAVADAAVLVTSVWINEQPTGAPVAAPAPESAPLATYTPCEPTLPEPKPKPKYGVGLGFDGALQLATVPSAGASAEVWRLGDNGLMSHTLGMRLWASHLVLSPRPDGDAYKPPLGELYYVFSAYPIQFTSAAFGVWGALHLGWRPVLNSPAAATARLSLGALARWAFTDSWAMIFRLGLNVEETRAVPVATLGINLTID
jgi:hypothetical protein